MNSYWVLFLALAFLISFSTSADFEWLFCDQQDLDCLNDENCFAEQNNATECFNNSPLLPLYNSQPTRILAEAITYPCLLNYSQYIQDNKYYNNLLNCTGTLFPNCQCGYQSYKCLYDTYCAQVLNNSTDCLRQNSFFNLNDNTYNASVFYSYTHSCINNETNPDAN